MKIEDKARHFADELEDVIVRFNDLPSSVIIMILANTIRQVCEEVRDESDD